MIHNFVNYDIALKLKAKWIPQFEQDFSAMTDENSPFYDAEFVSDILKDYKSIGEFKLSDDYVDMKTDYEKNEDLQ